MELMFQKKFPRLKYVNKGKIYNDRKITFALLILLIYIFFKHAMINKEEPMMYM